MVSGLLAGLAVLLMLGLVSCGDDDTTYETENCATVVDVSGQQLTLCCHLKCIADYDHNDYQEQCTETTTCTAPTGEACRPSVAFTLQYPVCF